MKRFVCLLLALVLILALAGCKVSSRPYRRYPADNGSYRTHEGTYRANTRVVNPGDAQQYNDSLYRSARRGTVNGGATIPSTVTTPPAGITPNRTNRPFNVPS